MPKEGNGERIILQMSVEIRKRIMMWEGVRERRKREGSVASIREYEGDKRSTWQRKIRERISL